MKAIQFSEYGGPEVLREVDVDEPHAGLGQVSEGPQIRAAVNKTVAITAIAMTLWRVVFQLSIDQKKQSINQLSGILRKVAMA